MDKNYYIKWNILLIAVVMLALFITAGLSVLPSHPGADIVSAASPATVTKNGNTWTLENDVLRTVISFDSGSIEMTSFYNKEAGKEYLTGLGSKYLFYYNYGGSNLYGNDAGWTLGTDMISNISLFQTAWGKRLEIQVSRTTPKNVQVKLVFEIYDGRSGLKYQNFIKNNESSNQTIANSDVIALNFPNQTHQLNYVSNMTWSSTTGALAPNTGLNAINVYNTGDGWYLQPEMNWKTQSGPATSCQKPTSSSMLPPFANISAWSGTDNVKVSTNSTALQLVLFPGEEFEYIAVNLSVFKGNVMDGKMAVQEHFRKRFKYNNVTAIFNTNDWEWLSKRSVANYYPNVVIPKATEAGFDMVMLDDLWNVNRDSTQAISSLGDMPTLANQVESTGMKFGLWFSMSGADHNCGRDLADPVKIAEKKSQVESLINNYHLSHQMVDLTEYWQNPNVTTYSHPSDNVYRKNVLNRNMINELVSQYPLYLPKLTSEVDIYPTQWDRNNGLLHIGNNGWVTANAGFGQGMKMAANNFGFLPMESLYITPGKMSGKMEDYYSYMTARNVKFTDDPGDITKWPAAGIQLMGQFNKWRKSPRIKAMTEEQYRPVYTGTNSDGPYVWMYTDELRSKALVIATAAGGTQTYVTADMRWLDSAKTYLVGDITLDDSGTNTYAFKGKYTGAQLKSPGFNIDLSENTSKGKALWIQQDNGMGLQVTYSDETISSYTSKVELDKSSITVNVTGNPNSSAKVIVTNADNNTGIVKNITIGSNGKGSSVIKATELMHPAPTAKPIYYEAESLTYTSSKIVDLVTDVGASGGIWHKLNATVKGDWVQYSVNVPAPGTYQVKVRYKAHEKRGINQLSIDGNAQGAAINQYATPPALKEADLGSVTFASAGNKLFKFTLQGTTSTLSSGTFWLSTDSIQLKPVTACTVFTATYQAENAAIVGGTLQSSNAGYTGTGYVDYQNAR
jgi:hypothetical protein